MDISITSRQYNISSQQKTNNSHTMATSASTTVLHRC